MRPFRLPELAALAMSAVLAIAPSACSSDKAPSGASAGTGTPQGKGPPPASVEAAKVRDGNLDSKIRFLGNVQSALSTPIAAAVAGSVDAVKVREGQAVAKGETMLELDARRIRAELRAAQALVDRSKAQLAQAQRQADRIKTSSAALSAPERERYLLEVAVLEAQLAAEEAAAERVRVDLSRHSIKAPFAGVVRAREVNPGAWVQPGNTVVELTSTAELEVMLDIPFENGAKVRTGDSALFIDGERKAKAIVAGIVPALDPNTRTMRLRLSLAEEGPAPTWLVPGLPLDVELDLRIEGKGVLVPRDAVIRGPVESRVIKIEGGVGVPVPVEFLGATSDEVMVRGEGLKAGDSVMTRGNERYRPGTPVQVGGAQAGGPQAGQP